MPKDQAGSPGAELGPPASRQWGWRLGAEHAGLQSLRLCQRGDDMTCLAPRLLRGIGPWGRGQQHLSPHSSILCSPNSLSFPGLFPEVLSGVPEGGFSLCQRRLKSPKSQGTGCLAPRSARQARALPSAHAEAVGPIASSLPSVGTWCLGLCSTSESEQNPILPGCHEEMPLQGSEVTCAACFGCRVARCLPASHSSFRNVASRDRQWPACWGS